MISIFTYELWDGKKVVGSYVSMFGLQGRELVVPESSILKQSYFGRIKQIRVPIIYRQLSDNGVDLVMRKCLDVRRKSKRQLKILTGASSPF